MNIYQVIVAPVVSEKSVSAQGNGKYSFLVKREATKTDVQRAIEEIYGVNVQGINMMVRLGKTRRLKKGTGIRRQERKKAIVTLKSGQVLDPGKVYADQRKKEEKK